VPPEVVLSVPSLSFLGEKGKFICYLHERGASEDQISSVFKILADIVRE
jgi:hypothetical protein